MISTGKNNGWFYIDIVRNKSKPKIPGGVDGLEFPVRELSKLPVELLLKRKI